MVSGVFAAVLALPVLALAAPAPTNSSALPPCGNLNRPCSCPGGTQFRNVTSYGIIGAPASDVAAVMNDCKFYRSLCSCSWTYQFNTDLQPDFVSDWTGLSPVRVTGTDDEVGATRTFNITANGASYELTEQVSFPLNSSPITPQHDFRKQHPSPQSSHTYNALIQLIEWASEPDGSFSQRYRQNPSKSHIKRLPAPNHHPFARQHKADLLTSLSPFSPTRRDPPHRPRRLLLPRLLGHLQGPADPRAQRDRHLLQRLPLRHW